MSKSAQDTTLRLGTRGSLLARMQSQMIADAVEKLHPDVKVELIICKTTDDKIQDKPLREMGGKGLFTKELEEALLADDVDFAVHSLKDVPVTMPLADQSTLAITAVPTRQDVRDVLVTASAKSIHELPAGAHVGTGSLRRRCQILALRPDVNVEPIRGNVDTRLRKLAEGQYDAMVLAQAGLKRSGLYDSTHMYDIPVDQILPAAGQGALAIQCRRDDERTRRLFEPLDDPVTHSCVDLERSVVLALNGDCHSPIAALASVDGGQVCLRVVVGSRGGGLPILRAHATASGDDPKSALEAVIKSLEQQGVRQSLGAL